MSQAKLNFANKLIKSKNNEIVHVHKLLSFTLQMLTDEQMCEYAHFAGGDCDYEYCPQIEFNEYSREEREVVA
jgi:hypothetical protein